MEKILKDLSDAFHELLGIGDPNDEEEWDDDDEDEEDNDD
jgi:hypothetical protein